ncbi:trypco2 family protein [Streptomyces sp. NPDC087440]|uniref:trypco2 family protein n=1 Tax=Streptomyces sp. NPDC087440 TaxID=3365790 RepID=UPI00382CC86F
MADASHPYDGIELADAVESIRSQLMRAAARSAGKEIAFTVGDIQMEFTVELRREVKGGAKVKAWVVEAGTDAGLATGRTHKVALTLTPVKAATGGSVAVGNDELPDISGFGDSGAEE